VRHSVGEGLDRRVQDDAGLITVALRADRWRDILGSVAVRRLARLEAAVGPQARLDTVDAEATPGLAVAVPGGEIPAAAGVHEAVRLDEAPARRVVGRAVREAQAELVAARARDCGQRFGVDRWSPALERNGIGLQSGYPAPRPRREDLLEVGQARTDVSSIPVTPRPAAVRNPTATATASSSSSSSGGSCAPAPSR
jgi:hypothetical protein